MNIFLVIPRILIFPELISAEDTFIFQKKGVFAVILLLVSFQSMCLDQATSGKYFCAIVAQNLDRFWPNLAVFGPKIQFFGGRE